VKNWFKSITNRAFICALFTLIVFNVYALVDDNVLTLQATKILTIPLFFSIYFIKNKFINNIFIVFLLLAFVGDFFSMMSVNQGQLKIASIAYFSCYAMLTLIGLFRIKGFKLKGLVGTYLVVVFLLNAYFMYLFYGTLAYNINDSTELLFTTLQIITLLGLGFIAFAGYLNNDGRQSIVFLLMSFCLIFAQVLNFLETYYIVCSRLMMLEWISHIAGFTFFYKYLAEHNRLSKLKTVDESIISTSVTEKIAA